MTEVPFLNHVPHFDVHGHHHHRKPYNDQGNLLKEDIRHDKWLAKTPPIRTRSELLQARKRGRFPDPSYDFDGDGAVGQLDYFIGRSFDSDCDGRLTEAERSKAQEALDKGFMDKHIRVMQDSGRIQQSHGLLMDNDHISKVANLYPPHFNADNIAEVGTKTALEVSRRAELRGVGAAFGERYAEGCARIPEPQPANAHTEPRQCAISHIRERTEADHQASRVRAGLLPTNTSVNPEREAKEIGLSRVEDPYFATRSQLRGARKDLMKQECEELRTKAEEVVIPNSIREAEKEWRQFEYQRPQGDAMTRTKLRDQRRRDKIEYDMNHFEAPRLPEYPRYSDRQDVPFWQATPEVKPQRAVRIASEPVLKVTDVPVAKEEHSRSAQSLGDSMKSTGEMARGPVFGSHTVRRWTTDMLERGQGRNKPRLFDNIQPVRIGPLDLMPLDLNSSMECVRNAARNGREEERQRSAANPLRSRLFNDTSAMQLSTSSLSASRTATKTGAGSQREQLGADGAGKVGLGGTAQLRKANSVTINDPVLRPAILTQVSDKPREPRFFGSMTRPASSTGVRCGGFQRFEHPASKQLPSNAQPQHILRSRGEPHHSKDRARSDPKENALSGTPVFAPAVQSS